MSELEDLRLFGRLVQRGVLSEDQVKGLLAKSQAAGCSLPEMAIQEGVLEPERLEILRALDGEEVPAIPGHDLLGLCGRGGTAIVVHARERKSGRDVAIKVLHEQLQASAEASKAFVHEAKLLMKLDHAHVVKGLRVGPFQGRLIFLMEFVPGESLLDLLRSGREFDEDSALFIILQVAQAMQYLTSQGVVHRDIKPDNILLTRENQVKLIDLGFATSAGQGGGEGETTVGTVAYISPEQARGQADVDVRSDIYSLGATLYQLVAGELPFEGKSNQEMMAAQILESLNSQVLKSGKISPHMHYFIEKMMAKEREIRYQDPSELIADIEEQIRGKKSLSFTPEDEQASDDLLRKPYQEDAPPKPPATPPITPIRRRRRR